jgi:molybdenum-dependent DNA-binding transcriptional regulator ModE
MPVHPRRRQFAVSFLALRDLMRALSAHRDGASINAAAKASGINYRTAQRIVEGAAEHCQRQLVAVV